MYKECAFLLGGGKELEEEKYEVCLLNLAISNNSLLMTV